MSIDPPPVPDLPDGLTPPKGAEAKDFELRLQGFVDEWKARWRDIEERAKAETTREEDRADKALEVEVARADKALEVEVARDDKALEVQVAREDAEIAAEAALLKSIQDAYVGVTTSSLDRSLQRATFVTTAATAVGTIYTTLLALVYSAGDKGTPLSARGIIPALFIGSALAFATTYVAFLQKTVKRRLLLPSGTNPVAEQRLKTFLDWTFSGVVARAWALRTAVISLGLGIALLPLPFIAVSALTTAFLVIVSSLILIGWLINEWISSKNPPPYVEIPDPPAAR